MDAEKRSFVGSFVNGVGFILSVEDAKELLDRDERNRNVLFPYLSGEDLNMRHDQSASRWIINFFDWPLERAEEYADCMRIVREKVKPARDSVNRKAHREFWWLYGDKRLHLYETVKPLSQVMAITAVSNLAQPAFVPTGQVFSHGLTVLAFDDDFAMGYLTSSIHWWWAATWASTMRNAIRYTPSDCFETLPCPRWSDAVVSSARRMYDERSHMMYARALGLTKISGLVNDPKQNAADIVALRELYVALDRDVTSAYGWSDLDLSHAFHETRQGIRYTVGPTARVELLDRLLELNHEQHATNEFQGKATRGTGASSRRGGSDIQLSFDEASQT